MLHRQASFLVEGNCKVQYYFLTFLRTINDQMLMLANCREFVYFIPFAAINSTRYLADINNVVIVF